MEDADFEFVIFNGNTSYKVFNISEAILTVALPETLASIKLLGLLDIEVLEMPF